ncbi:midasin [Musca vetustissima]|uniref:midasin n=1 Tax=Musca vetustissima TaxID=27455 RepID=UPI002AB7C7AB|nr:midasin [Musca vetustissima]
MEFKETRIRQNIQHLVSLIKFQCEQKKYLEAFLQKKLLQEKDVENLLKFLSSSLLVEDLTVPIALAFEDCLLLLVTNAVADSDVNSSISSGFNDEKFYEYQRKAVALAKLIHLSLSVKRYALTYFSNKPAIFSSNLMTNGVSNKKSKSNIDERTPLNEEVIIKSCYYLLKSNVNYFKELWNWSDFIERYANMVHDDKSPPSLLKLYINHILALLTNMSSQKLRSLNANIPEKLLLQFEEDLTKLTNNKNSIPYDTQQQDDDKRIIKVNLNSSLVTNIEGVLLPIYNKANYEFYSKTDGLHDKIVRVDSTKVNLRSIALGTTAGKAICLSGPVGCGKTTLVEYLARKTGRICPKQQEIENEMDATKKKLSKENQQNGHANIPKVGVKRKTEPTPPAVDVVKNADEMFKAAESSEPENGFVRVQLGDQTDCKTLLGQYHCTDVPGEFIWLPGVLTQAVMNGYWLLLEDLDSATTDTFTVLSGLLENQYLSVPGFRDCVKIAPGFQLFVTVRNNKTSSNSSQKALFSLLEKYLYTINILPLSRNELCKVVSTNYTKLATVANRIVDVFLTFSKGNHDVADNLRQQETEDRANNTEQYLQLPHEEVNLNSVTNSGRLVSTRDLIKLCQRSNPVFSVTSAECAYFVFQNAVDIFCSYLPHSKEKTKLITSIGAKLGIIQSRCEHFAEEYKPEVQLQADRIKVGRAELQARSPIDDVVSTSVTERVEEQALKRFKLTNGSEKSIKATQKKSATFSFTRLASCLLERVAVCVANAEPILLVGETGVGKTSSVQYLAERTKHKLVVINMNNQSDVSDLVGGFKPVDLACVIAPLRTEFEILFRKTFNQAKNEAFLTKFSICYNQGNFSIVVKLMLKIVQSVFEKSERNELRDKDLLLLPRWLDLKIKLHKLNNQLNKSINISFAFIPGSLVKCIKNGDWVLLDEINLASAETLECLSTILEPEGSVVLLEKGDFIPVKRHPDFRIFACMNPNTDIGKKDLSVGIRNRFTEFFVDEVSTEADLSLLISDYLSATGIQKKSVMNIVKLYKKLKQLAKLELNDGLGNRPVYSLRTLCRSLAICAKNLCGSIERNLYESFCLSFLTQLDPVSHNVVEHLIKEAMLSNAKAILSQGIPKPGEQYLNFEGYWIQQGPKEVEECSNYILTDSVKNNLRDLARIISIGKLPILLQGPTSAGKTSLIDYVARRSGNHCLRINNHEHTDLQEYIGTYTADATGKLSFKEGVLVQAMRNGFWIILDELNLASTEILEALNRVLDDNRELFIPETQTVIKAHPNFMLFATQNPPGLYGGRKTLSRAFKNRFIELHFSDIPRNELEIILEKKCLIPPSYARKMVSCMMDLQKNRKTTTKNVFTLRDLFRWGIRYTLADKKLLEDGNYDWNQHLIEEGYLVLSAKVRSQIEIEIIEEALFKNFRKKIDLSKLFDAKSEATPSPVTKDIIEAIRKFTQRSDIVWTRNMSRMAVLTAKALQFDEPVLLVGPTGCGKTTVCQILAAIKGVNLRILNCHMHTEGADFLGGLRPCRTQSEGEKKSNAKLFEWTDGPLIQCMLEGCYFMADEISLAEDSVLERLNSVLEPERTVLLAEKGGLTKSSSDTEIVSEFLVKAKEGFQFLATMNPGGDFGKKELSPALRNRFAEIWCQPSDSREDLIQIASNCILNEQKELNLDKNEVVKIASFIVEVVLYIKDVIEKFKYSVRDILAMANYLVRNKSLSFPEKAVFGLETIFLDALEMLTNDSMDKVENLRMQILEYAIRQANVILKEKFSLGELKEKKGTSVEYTQDNRFGIKPFFIETNLKHQGEVVTKGQDFLFDAPTTKQNLFRLLSALSLQKPILLEGPPGVGKTSIVENVARAIGYNIVRINLCEHTDLADLFGTDLPAEDNILNTQQENGETKSPQIGSFVWRDGPLLSALEADHTWILLDELNLAPQSVLEGLNAILDHRGEVYIPELNKTFALNKQTRIFASQNPLKQGGGRKGLPQSFLNRFTKVYVRKLTTEDLLHVIEGKYETNFAELKQQFIETLPADKSNGNLFDIYKSMKANSALNNESSAQDEITFDIALRLVRFSETLDRGITTMEFGYRGGPYEINLRDILRWCDLLIGPQTGYTVRKQSTFQQNFEHFLLVLYERMKLVYYQRMRCEQDKQFIRNAFAQIFQCDVDYLNAISEDVSLYWTDDKIYINDIVLERDTKPLRSSKDNGDSTLPLLLASQRETLKNVIECLHMEKPVLLCGSTDSGKTKIIDAVCCLSNQLCNTDNIDDSVTGSFQQIDLNRHLEEISKQVESIYLHYIQDAILDSSSSKKDLIDVYDAWSNYSILSNAKCEFRNKSVVSEELTIYRKRIANLNICIEKLCQRLTNENETSLAELKHLQNLLQLLKAHVENADTLNTGGYFEWVDSQIVRSLKYGQYISLEHVNLCSSAVLDRLNPVFEPNGCLMISEKGVSKDNDLTEVVKKSPNFRAFLTIDPKNGELSRAMRNRCVELALTGKGSLDLDDKRLLVYNQGIYDVDAINTLIAIHEGISGLTEINNFSISHLIQMAFLVASYKRIGYQMHRAIYVSAMEVYVYSAHIDLMGYGLAYYQNKLREIVADLSQKYADLKVTHPEGQQQEDYFKDVLMNCSSLNETSMIKLQLVPLRIALNQGITSTAELKQILEQVFAGFAQTNIENVELTALRKYVIYMLYESSSVKDLKLRHLMLSQLLERQPELKQLSDDLYESIKSGVQELGIDSVCHNLPWNPKLYSRIRDYSMETLDVLNNKSLALSSTMIVKTLLTEIPHEAVNKLSNINAITYSQAVANKTITDKLNNEFLQNYSKLMENLENVLKSSLKQGHIDMKNFVKLHTSVLWFNRLLAVSKGNIFLNKEVNVDLMDKLQLHFKWLDKKLIKTIEQLLPEDDALLKLKQSLEIVRNYIESVKHPLNIVRKLYAKQLMQFQPFYKEDQIKLFTITQQMDQLIQLIPQYGSFSADDVTRKFTTLNSDNKRKLQALIQRFYKKYDFTKFNEIHLNGGENAIPENLKQELQRFINNCSPDDNNGERVNDISPEEIDEIEEELKKLAASLNVDQADEMHVDQFLEKPQEMNLLLLALREYYLLKYFMAILHNRELKQLPSINYEYCEEVVSLNNNAMALLNTLNSKQYENYRQVYQNLESNLNTPESVQQFVKYLNGGYRQFTSLQRLLDNALIRLQMSSISNQGGFMLALRNNEDISSMSVYQGPSVINTLCDLLLASDGGFKPVPLCNLDLWRSSLENLNQIIWHNSMIMTNSYCALENTGKVALAKAKRLILEIGYVQQLAKGKEEVMDASNYMNGFQKLFANLKQQVSRVEVDSSTLPSVHKSLENQLKLFNSGILTTLSGALELCLLTFTPLIDPVEKSRLKNNYLLEDIQCLLTMSAAYEFLRIPMKYKHLGQEIYDSLQFDMEELKLKQSKFEERVALRPNKCIYTNLVKDLTHFLNTNCDPNVLYNFLENIKQIWSQLTMGDNGAQGSINTLDGCNEIINKLDLWLANSQRFIHHTMKPYYGHYQDFMQPIECAINHLSLGFQNLKTALSQVKEAMLSKDKDQVNNVNANGKLHLVLENIMEFPSSQNLAIYNVNSSRDILQNRCPIFSVLNEVPGSERDYFLLLKAKLLELKNRVNISTVISEELYKELDFAFNIINQIWQQEEERRRQKKKEDESLYATKTKCQDEDEELMELQEIEEMFPTGLQEDFGEFVQEDTLEKVMKLDKKKTEKLKDLKSPIVKDEDYGFIATTFADILINYTQAYYHQRNKSTSTEKLDFVEYYKKRLAVFSRIYNSYKAAVNEIMDGQCYNSLCFSISLQQDLLNDTGNYKLPQKQHSYNFYKDSNISEILNCTDVLKAIEERVDKELELYPEHATLLDIKRIIARIRLLPSTASVVRFNTGFQLLRQKVAQWNEVAHKNNHLKAEEQEIAEYVQRWTRLELQFWRNCMSQTEEKVETSAYKYWFFIYNLLQEYLAGCEIDSSLSDIRETEKRFANLETQEPDSSSKPAADCKSKVELKDILQILRQFVESSCYGDFEIRLQLLMAFELYLHNSLNYCQEGGEEENHKLQLIYGLRNLQLYFAQFGKEIVEHNKAIRGPIEKKLKELVKIESYNKDLSYFSMRNNVARVHRNLNKFLKEYEKLLKEKITPVFQPQDATAKDYNMANDKGKDLRQDSTIQYCRVDGKLYMLAQKLKPITNTAPAGEEDEDKVGHLTLLHKVQKLFNTSRNVVKETVTNALYPKLTIALDTLLSEQLERCEHLRNLTVDRSKERPKQVLEAKSILQQKRKGLTDLFKILSNLGLNYKTGLLELQLRSEFEDFTLPAFCIKTMLIPLGKAKRLQPQILQLNENIDLYFNKSVFKLKLLQNIMLTPLSELGPPNIERIKGFAVDFFLLVQNQRQLLAQTTKNIYDYHLTLQQIKELDSSIQQSGQDLKHLDFQALRDQYNIFKADFIKIRYVFEQFKLFWNCVPKKQQPENALFQGNNPLLQNSEQFNTILGYAQQILKLCKSTLKDIMENNHEFLGQAKIQRYQEAHNSILDIMQKLLECFEIAAGEFLPIARPLIDLSNSLEQTKNRLHKESSTSSESSLMEIKENSLENITPELENIIHCILMALQKLYKKYPSSKSSEENNGSPKRKEEEGAEDDLQEQHLKSKIYNELKDDWLTMQVDLINSKLSNILLNLKLTQPSAEKQQLIQHLLTVQPLLEQFNLMAEYYLLQQLGAHKVSVKILSIVLTVFVEISTKGFCVPQDLMQDEQGEQKKDQKEGEGFGLEDGTGEKDASDKIESEDQLEDAKRPEDRKEEQNKNEDQQDTKEEKGIELSEDFEGKSEKPDKPEEDDSGESEDEEELNKEMGETEDGAEKLDDQIWGDDEEEPEEEEKELEEEEDGKGSKDEKDSHNDLNSKDEQAKEGEQNNEEETGLDSTNDPKEDKRKQQEKDIEDMKDQEQDDEQTNPYHNELEEPPEPEDFDMGDVNMDDKEENEQDDDKGGDDNPFDIDTMKENMPEQEDKSQENDDENQEENPDKNEDGDDSDDSDEDESGEKDLMKEDKSQQQEEEGEDNPEEGEQEEEEAEQQKRAETTPEGEEEEKPNEEESEENKEEKPENYEQSKDKVSKEENIQSTPDTEVDGSKDQMPAEQTEKDVQQEQTMDEQDTGEEKDGVGQAENDTTDGGHQGVAETKETATQEERKNERKTEEKRRQGQTNEERTLGEAEKNKIKQLKTIDKLNEKQQEDKANEEDNQEEQDQEMEADEYQHVKDPKANDMTTLDNATEEQSKKMQHLEDEEKKDNEEENDDGETNENMDLDEEPPVGAEDENEENLEEMSAEKMEKNKDKPSKSSEKTKERAETQEEMEIEGEVVQTITVPRSNDTTAHCNTELLINDSSNVEDMTTAEALELRKLYQQQVTTQKPAVPTSDDQESWQVISNRMTQNARDLCEQLRLILEPTKCTRLKGDYRTGRRINMKKIIPYIASQFRKDKIWLRRTKPAQRDYKITIAIDDSKSMHHNNSKTLTLEAISLVSQALTLLESGRLSVVSFGEQPQILLNHTEQFDGPKLVNSLQFSQDKTKIAGLLDFIRTINAEEGAMGSSDNGLFENLLLILSDGRNIFSEGKMKVKNAIKLARLQRIFLVYIIIDNPDNKNSILDIQTMEMLPDKRINIKSYLDDFPFPYYVIVRDLNQLPLVLSEAMRQWFEMVNSEQ